MTLTHRMWQAQRSGPAVSVGHQRITVVWSFRSLITTDKGRYH